MSNFKIFKDEVNRLLAKTQTGGGWSVTFRQYRDTDPEGCAASVTYNAVARYARFNFNTGSCDNTLSGAKKAAKHEFGHFVTARLERLACRRFTTEAEIEEEMEAIARIFERM